MIDLRRVLYLAGLLTCFVGVALCVPALIDFSQKNADWEHFMFAAVISLFLGGMLATATRQDGRVQIGIREAFLVTIFAWIIVALLAAIPFLALGISFTDAVFESMSGITTTGSTVLTELDSLPTGILFWRAFLQWIGGIGIIAMAIVLLPLMRVGGMQIFRIESSDTTEKIDSSVGKIVAKLFLVYTTLTCLCAFLYLAFGMSGFDAIAHAMTTLSTGGYSTHDASFGYFSEPGLHWTATAFMLAGAIPFALYIKTVRGNFNSIVTDEQVKGFIVFIVAISAIMAWWLMEQRDIGFFQAVTLTSFNITSVVTTTGYASDDYTAWGPGAVGIFLVLMFVGGCSGSTSGAIKIYRFQILLSIIRTHVRHLYSPHRIQILKYNGKRLDDDVPYSILSFLAVFIATIAVSTAALALAGLDIVTAYSGSVTAITNVGPGLGTVIGPSGNFQSLPDAAKWILTIAMLAGRLEVLALLVALDRDFWRS
ncbi:TrkH family potassium uptake protein [Pelagibius sp.]|uniref:TrkH family potassium uptake protein n=1 Tax=Pelagibius sp. TaxID=1931238 RepID=UPI003BB12637